MSIEHDDTCNLDLPAKINRIIDGDTVEVTVEVPLHIRLLDCWAPEKRTEAGQRSSANLRAIANHGEGRLTIPFKPGRILAESLSFDRVLGRISIDGIDLSQAQIDAGHATAEKAK